MPKFEPKTLRVAKRPLPGKFASNPGYATRMMQVGETFQAAKPIYQHVLLAAKKVELVRDPVDLPAPKPELLEKAAAQGPKPARQRRTNAK
jgi:hypothetical protein